MTDTTVTIVGNLTRDPELRYTPSGASVAEFGVAVNKRIKGAGGEWEDGDPEFYDVTAWGSTAENIAESLTKGTRVVAVGRLQFDSWENDAGEKRSKVKVVADHIGPELRWATVDITRNEKGGGRDRQPVAQQTPSADPEESPF